MNRSSSHKSVVMLLGVALLFAAGAPETLVLCVGNDGHAASEVLSSGSCGPHDEAGAGGSELPAYVGDTGGDHCGPCVDMLLLQHVAQNKLTSAKARLGHAQVALPAPTPAVIDARATSVSSRSVSPACAIGRGAERDIVLLI
jgi:hypothetical protein